MDEQEKQFKPQDSGEKPFEPGGQIERQGSGQPSDEREEQEQVRPERGDNTGFNKEVDERKHERRAQE